MQETVKKVLNGDFNRKKALLFLITALLTVIVWNLPIDSFGIEGLTIVQQRVSIFIYTAFECLIAPDNMHRIPSVLCGKAI